MKRYWHVKSTNFDKVVFFRFGKWFMVLYQDAVLGNKFLDLCAPPRERSWVGFHENNLHENVETMVNAGFKVAIAEQTESGAQCVARTNEEKKKLPPGEKKNVIVAAIREV